jgi:hypothetical protein
VSFQRASSSRRCDGADGTVREVGEVVQGEACVVERDAVRKQDAPAVGSDAPTAARGAAVVDPSEYVGKEGAGCEVDAVGAAAGRPVRQSDGAGLGDGAVGEVAGAAADAGQLLGSKRYVTSARFHHRRLNAPSKE